MTSIEDATKADVVWNLNKGGCVNLWTRGPTIFTEVIYGCSLTAISRR